MADYSDRNGRTWVDVMEPLEGAATKTKCEGKHAPHRSSKDAADGDASGVASFSTNSNSVVCLPLVSEGLKLVWTQADQTRELDAIPELVQAFNSFPYPTSREVTALARGCALPLDKVKVWFMVQRIKYGISWASEEIEETRRKLSVPEPSGDGAETAEEAKTKGKRKSEELIMEDTESDHIDSAPAGLLPQQKKPKYVSQVSYKPANPIVPCFSSSLPPPQDSYYYRPPADMPETAAADVSLDLSETSSQQRRHGRYKKSKAQLAVLRSSFLRENWPAETELRRLQEDTGLSRNDIRKWFSDSRYQLRVGRGTLAAAQVYSHHTAAAVRDDQQLQPLPLITQKTRQQLNGVKVHEGARSNGIKDSHFFQTFLSNSLEAFGERDVEVEAGGYAAAGESSDNGDTFRDEEQSEEKPLELTKTSVAVPDVPQQPSGILKASPCSSPSGTPPPTASPDKRGSDGMATSKKSAHSAKTALRLSGASSSSSFTPAGRPRKTKEQLDVLKQHFLCCPWPKSDEYTELVKLTGLPRADVIQWFGDTRYAVKNGQLRWVQGAREQTLTEIPPQQSGIALSNGSGSGATPRVAGSRRRKAPANGTSVHAASPDIQPLVAYQHLMGTLHEKDLDTLCKKSRMSYQQVRGWFASQESGELDQELNVTD